MQVPVGPFFLDPYKLQTGGVDFLGLRQVNLDLMADCIPGINNATYYVRPFSVLAWIHWKFFEKAGSGGRTQVTLHEFQRFSEKVESLFTWGHIHAGIGRIPGSQSNVPASERGFVRLDFDAWDRQAQNTSLMAPVQYGPAAKTTGGLGFLEPVADGFFRACGRGVELAKALDAKLSRTAAYKLVTDLAEVRGREVDALALFKAWSVKVPTREERRVFEHALFQRDQLEEDTRIGSRSRAVQLIRDCLANASEPLTSGEIRRAMTYRRHKGGKHFTLEGRTAAHQLHWLVLQLRQAQRLAFECLFSFLEREILDEGKNDVVGVLEVALQHLEESGVVKHEDEELGLVIRRIWDPKHQAEFLRDLGSRPDRDFLHDMEELADAIRGDDRSPVAYAMRLLVITGRAARVLKGEAEIAPLLRWGGAARVSLNYWGEIVERARVDSVDRFLRFVFENFVLSQHLAVAAGRYDGKVQRIRVAIEEEGLRALVDKPSKPDATPDRLETALSLMSDCGLVRRYGDRFVSA